MGQQGQQQRVILLENRISVSIPADSPNFTSDPSRVPPLTLGKSTCCLFPSLHEHCPPPKALEHSPHILLPIIFLQSQGRGWRRGYWGVVSGRVTLNWPLNWHFLVRPAGRGMAPNAGSSSSLRSEELNIFYHQLCALAQVQETSFEALLYTELSGFQNLSHPCHPPLSS